MEEDRLYKNSCALLNAGEELRSSEPYREWRDAINKCINNINHRDITNSEPIDVKLIHEGYLHYTVLMTSSVFKKYDKAFTDLYLRTFRLKGES